MPACLYTASQDKGGWWRVYCFAALSSQQIQHLVVWLFQDHEVSPSFSPRVVRSWVICPWLASLTTGYLILGWLPAQERLTGAAGDPTCINVDASDRLAAMPDIAPPAIQGCSNSLLGTCPSCWLHRHCCWGQCHLHNHDCPALHTTARPVARVAADKHAGAIRCND